jgi:uncharacterized protein (TIGR00725 family)
VRPVACIGVVGPGQEASPQDVRHAREVGRALDRAGAVLLCGGLGGVMAAAVAGCAEEGGTSVGLLPGSDRSAAAPGLTVALPTGLGELRNGLLVRCCDALVAVGGSWGTLSEVALARRTGVPVVVLGGWSVRTPDGEQPLGEPADDPEDAVRRALARAAG